MISVIIPVCGNLAERWQNFGAVMRCLELQTYRDFEIVLVEQCTEARYFVNGLMRDGDRYQAIWGEPFNLSWCRNVGAKLSAGETLLMLDSDIIFGRDYLARIHKEFKRSYALGWNQMTTLSEAGRQRYMSERDPGANWLDSEIMAIRPAERGDAGQGGAGIFQRKWFFERFGGFCEDFENWGGEDCEAMNRAEALTGEWSVMEYPLTHLWHGYRAPFEPANQEKLRISRADPLLIAQRLVAKRTGNLARQTTIFGELE